MLIQTRTFTQTTTRLSYLEAISRRLTQQTCNMPDDVYERSILPALRERWIVGIAVRGMDEQQNCRAWLALRLDWDRHQYHLDAGELIHEDDPGNPDRHSGIRHPVPPGLNAHGFLESLTRAFLQLAEKHRLKMVCSVFRNDSINSEEFYERLHLVPTKPYYKRSQERQSMPNVPLDPLDEVEVLLETFPRV